MPTDATTLNRGWAPRGAETSSCSCCGPRPSRAASPALPTNSACTRTRFGFTSTRWLRAGRVEQVLGDSAGRGRPPILFRASRRMDPTGPTNYRLLASILTGYVARRPDAAGIAAQLGRSTSPALVPSSAQRRAPSKTRAVTELVELLAELGFEPEPADGPRTREIRLRHCPFQNLAEQHGEVICSVHLGLMQGALSAMRAPVTVDRLDPFVEPDLCVARLAPAPTRDRES